MKLSELLVDAWVALPLQSTSLQQALEELLGRVAGADDGEDLWARKLAQDLATGGRGAVAHVGEGVVAVLAAADRVEALSVTVGVAAEVFPVPADGEPEERPVRGVILVLTPSRLSSVRQDLVPVLCKVFRDPQRTTRLLKARTIDEIRGFKEFMEAEFRPRLLVEDALAPVKYRVYPDTPLDEVLDLMVRRGVHAVPVVGEQYEVLGILTSGDALEYLLRRGGREGDPVSGGGSEEAVAARDYMTRTVLCVSEGQSLVEAANMMVNRDVEQLPVVREGELVGFVTRDSILRVLTGAFDPETEDKTENEFEA